MATIMRSALFRPNSRICSLGFGLTGAVLATQIHYARQQHPSRALRCDAPRGFEEAELKLRQAASSSASKSGIDARSARQVSAGSIIGLVSGLAVSTFSKPLTLLIGLLVLGAQALESRGIHLIPYNRIQRLFRDVDVKKMASKNVPFKFAFGLTFTLAAFTHF